MMMGSLMWQLRLLGPSLSSLSSTHPLGRRGTDGGAEYTSSLTSLRAKIALQVVTMVQYRSGNSQAACNLATFPTAIERGLMSPGTNIRQRIVCIMIE